MGAPIFPSELRKLVYRLRVEKRESLTTILETAKAHFPDCKDRLNIKSIGAMIRRMRDHSGKIKRTALNESSNLLPAALTTPDSFANAVFAKIAKKEEHQKVDPDMLTTASKLREKGLRWGAITEFLHKEYPTMNIPQPGRLAVIVRNQRGTPKVFKLTLEGSGGVMLRMDLPNKKVTKIIKTLLDLEE